MPSPGELTRLLILVTSAAGMAFLASEPFVRSTLRRHWTWLLGAGVLLVVWRIPFFTPWFHGLEYEDAYVYAVAGRELLEGFEAQQDSWLTTVCTMGSLQSCEQTETFSGHYIGYPALLAVVGSFTGFAPNLSNIVSLVSAALIAVVIFILCLAITNQLESSLIGVVLFIVTPAYSVHGVASFSEPVSCAAVALPLLAYLAHVRNPVQHAPTLATVQWLLLSCGFMYAIIVKRENLMVPLACIFVEILRLGRRRSVDGATIRINSALVLAVISGGLVLNIEEMLVSETGEYGGFPFRFEVFRDLGPAFVVSFLTPQWYLAISPLAAVGCYSALRRWPLARLPVLLLLGYLTLYTTHVRSYYQLFYGDLEPYDALRYSVNLMALVSVLGGLGGAVLVGWLRSRYTFPTPWRLVLPGTVLASYLVTSFTLTAGLRDELTRSEQDGRIAPALAVASLAADLGPETYIITAEPLLIQIYSDVGTRVIDLASLDDTQVQGRVTRGNGVATLYLDQEAYRTEADRKRYATQLDFLDQLSRNALQSEQQFTVWQVE